ncbi:Uncharacterized conserved protein, Ntn-hydrolase superfamily [Pedococcus dokdonensis]|uniref:Uncharacterized conserved protein, Ntn-hydrolase superfamily n=1 Tax=Pedococcus dokdonensis TaxID=443156 RepID=A0A1H0SJJ5_9MICO|nr:DUF1028 domain-containing protein [Pedococcus dokdonensis]SDP41709.1 Uncharacterized conserved protein, Ntn-hydrolase superfamily [Pedococcus dokdonensis]
MTFSIVGQVGDAFGVAVASKFPFVGAVVPQVRLGVGAVATQAMARVAYRSVALDSLASGAGADDAVAACTAPDPDRAHRQLGVVGLDSQATWTGGACMDWAGGVSGRDETGGYAIQGNILTGSDVVSEMEAAWLASVGSSLTDRLVATLLAGDAAGGDSRGRQGAALYAVQPGAGYDHCGVLADLRVDDHDDAPQELARLLRINDLVFGGPEDVSPLAGDLADEVAVRLAHLGYSGTLTDALGAWAGEANYEMRMAPDGIDAKVLAALRDATPDA